MKRIRFAPVEPSDTKAYLKLLGDCVEARDKAALIALMPAIVTFEGGRFEQDFKREWMNRWIHLGLPLEDTPDWPEGGAFSRHRRETPGSTTPPAKT